MPQSRKLRSKVKDPSSASVSTNRVPVASRANLLARSWSASRGLNRAIRAPVSASSFTRPPFLWPSVQVVIVIECLVGRLERGAADKGVNGILMVGRRTRRGLRPAQVHHHGLPHEGRDRDATPRRQEPQVPIRLRGQPDVRGRVPRHRGTVVLPTAAGQKPSAIATPLPVARGDRAVAWRSRSGAT